jgi:predicted GIY-YIG superfamily endonuclease
MHYVYLIESVNAAEHRYVGLTSDLKRRLHEHNSGRSPHTSKHVPWRLVTYMAFSSPGSAAKFERYLKSGSGHAFAKKRLWSSEIDPIERFRKQICFSSYMKAALKQTQRDICPVCTTPLWRRQVVIHHKDYLHQCEWAGTIYSKAAGKDVEVPDCADCARDDHARFEACRKRLQLLHRGCHAQYHAGLKTMK